MSTLQHVSRSLGRALRSRVTVALFAFLALTSQLPAVVDIYDSPVYHALFIPSYVVSLVFYDGPLGLENLVYPVATVVPIDGSLLWDAGQIVTFYLFAVAVGWVAEWVRGRMRPRGQEDAGLTP